MNGCIPRIVLKMLRNRFKRETYKVGTSKAWTNSRCILRTEFILVSDCLDEKTLGRMFIRKAPNLDSAIHMALGRDAKILVLRNTADMIPIREVASLSEILD